MLQQKFDEFVDVHANFSRFWGQNARSTPLPAGLAMISNVWSNRLFIYEMSSPSVQYVQ